MYPTCGKLYPDGLKALARADDYDQVRSVAEYYWVIFILLVTLFVEMLFLFFKIAFIVLFVKMVDVSVGWMVSTISEVS